jgi:hypothetical protein
MFYHLFAYTVALKGVDCTGTYSSGLAEQAKIVLKRFFCEKDKRHRYSVSVFLAKKTGSRIYKYEAIQVYTYLYNSECKPQLSEPFALKPFIR